MPVPSTIADLSTTPGSNSPAGSESPALMDDYLRTAFAFIKQVSDTKLDASSGVALTGNQTIAGTKTFSSPIAGSVTGTAANVTGTVAIAKGGTGQTTAAAAFNAIKQAATETDSGAVELATTAEASAGTDTTRAVTPAGIEAHMTANAIGWGQTWQNVSGSRANNTNYTNTTGRPIMVSVWPNISTAFDGILTVDGGDIARTANTSVSATNQITAIVPPGSFYRVTFTTGSIGTWVELR